MFGSKNVLVSGSEELESEEENQPRHAHDEFPPLEVWGPDLSEKVAQLQPYGVVLGEGDGCWACLWLGDDWPRLVSEEILDLQAETTKKLNNSLEQVERITQKNHRMHINTYKIYRTYIKCRSTHV